MKKILILTVILSIPVVALMTFAVCGTIQIPVTMISYILARRIWLLIAISSPIALIYGALREKFGIPLKKFLLAVCISPVVAAMIYGTVLLCIGSATGGWSGLLALALALGTDIVVILIVLSAAIWTAFHHHFESKRSEKAQKTAATICLVLCGGAIGADLRDMSHFSLATVVWITNEYNFMERIISFLPVIVFAGLAAGGIMVFYRKKYDLKPPIFILCAFLPGFLITGLVTLINSPNNPIKFHAGVENLVALTAALVISVIFYSVIRLIQSQKQQSY